MFLFLLKKNNKKKTNKIAIFPMALMGQHIDYDGIKTEIRAFTVKYTKSRERKRQDEDKILNLITK